MALRPLPVPHPDEIVAVASEMRDDDTGGFQYLFSMEALKDFQRRAQPFNAVFGMRPRVGGMSFEGHAAQFWFSAVSDNYLSALGVKPAAGTLFTASSGAPAAIVLGHTFWMKKFGGDPGVIGRRIRVDGSPAVIIGVVQPECRGTLLGVEMDGYVKEWFCRSSTRPTGSRSAPCRPCSPCWRWPRAICRHDGRRRSR